MTDDTPKRRRYYNTKGLKRFGHDKPAVPGPGRPRLTEAEHEERRILKEASPEAAERLRAALKSKNEKNAIRAAEVILGKTVPDLNEGVMKVEHSPLAQLPDDAITEILADALSLGALPAPQNGDRRDGGPA